MGKYKLASVFVLIQFSTNVCFSFLPEIFHSSLSGYVESLLFFLLSILLPYIILRNQINQENIKEISEFVSLIQFIFLLIMVIWQGFESIGLIQLIIYPVLGYWIPRFLARFIKPSKPIVP